jgi:hypothetical protein
MEGIDSWLSEYQSIVDGTTKEEDYQDGRPFPE